MAQGTTRGVPIDTDPLLAADSDLLVASQKATKAYADTKQTALGFTPENVANKTTDINGISGTYPDTPTVKTYADTKQSKVLSVDLATNQTTSSNVVANISTLVSPTLEANKTYYVTGRLIVACSGTGGIRLAASFSGLTVSLGLLGNTTGATTFVTTSILASGTLATATNTNASIQTFVYINGTIVVGASPTTIQMQFASGTNGQTSTVYGTNNVLGFGSPSYLVFTPKT